MLKAVWQLRFARGLVALCALLAFAQPAFAQTYHSVAYDFSLSVPPDWTQVADDVRLAYGPDLPMPHASQGKVDVIFQQSKGNSGGIDYPCIVVEVAPYSGLGYPQQVTDEEMRTVVKATTGLDPANPYSLDTQVMEGGGEDEGVLHMDHDARRYTWNWTSKVREGAEVGLVRQRQWGFFGRDAVVTVTLYERGRGSDRLRDMATAVAGSFRFGIGREYQPAFTLGDALQMVKDLFAAPTLGMAVTLLCVGTSVIFALVAIFSARNRAPAYGDFRVDQDLASFTPPDRHEL